MTNLGVLFAVICFSLEIVLSGCDNFVCPVLDPADPGDQKKDYEGGLSATQKCFLDCTRSDALDFICENVGILDILANANIVPDLGGRRVNVFIWNSGDLVQLEVTIFANLRSRIRSLNLMNISGLINFPILRDMVGLDVLKIENAPSLTQFSADILPQSLKKVVLFQTGIGVLNGDLQDDRLLNLLTTIVFGNHTIYAISDTFFHAAPNIRSVTLRFNTFMLSQVPDLPLVTRRPVQEFFLTDSDFSAMSIELRVAFLENLLGAINVSDNTILDLSNNNLLFSKSVVRNFKNIRNISALSLADNEFGQFFLAADMFHGFGNLKRLDLANTNLPKQKGVLRGLDQLELLILRGNNFRDLTRLDIFDGCNAKLTTLDLSSNMLMKLPTGDFLTMTHSIRELILTNNTFHNENMDTSTDDLPNPIPTSYDFSNLQTLDLSFCGLQSFKGSWIGNLSSLIRLDLSCNKIKSISRDFFLGLPASLQVLNLSFCVNSMPERPNIDKDAFSGLGENGTASSFRSLILSAGYFKSWILTRLMQLPSVTRSNLRELNLSRNQIRLLKSEYVRNFTELTSLDLSYNFILNVGKRTFSGMTNLASLNLAHNYLVCIERNYFIDLPNLVTLDLSYNHIINIDTSAFDDLPSIKALYLGWNKLATLNDSFVTGGSTLEHLGLQGNKITLRTYPEGCLNREAFEPLTNLQYYYIDDSTAVFVDHGTSLASLEDKMKATVMKPNDPSSMQCTFGYRLDKPQTSIVAIQAELEPGGSEVWTDDFLRLVVQNPLDLSPRTFVAVVPKCMSPIVKHVDNTTTDSFCPNSDSKTYNPNTEKKKDDS